MKRFLAECSGTFFLAMAVNFTGDAMAIGLMYMAMVYLLGPLSGGHFNPAVSLSMALYGRISFLHALGYFGAQLLGSCIFFALAYGIFGAVIPARVIPADALVGAGAFELLLTMVFCSVALYLSVYKSKDSHVYGLIIGLTLIGLMTFPGLYNPALALGSIGANLLGGQGAMPGVNEVLIYVCLPLIAAVAAALKLKWYYGPVVNPHTPEHRAHQGM